MKIEHIGFLVEKPISMATWWINFLGFEMIRQAGNDEDGVVFIKDENNTIIEFGRIKNENPIDFNLLEPLQVHIAIECENPESESIKLIKNGATLIGESYRNDYKNEKILIKDPYGAVIQLITRKFKII